MKGINLEQNKIAILKKYKFRFWTILFVFLIATCVLASLLVYGYFVQIEINQKIFQNKLDEITNSDTTKNRIEFRDLSISANEKLKRINQNKILPNYILKTFDSIILSQRNISIDKYLINFKNTTNNSGTKTESFVEIEISGIAKDRSDLLAFQDNLKKELLFKNVEIPFSNFIRNENISFTAKITSVNIDTYKKK
ncbi:MAG TPA: hypothetical protein PJ997_01310 [Candidatus Paceibacterota bacterium]|nr:hypothetical protein [Candidatus Paceibacterota bacterium]HMP18959.1 hypothetical protein [Candidatus Paceibacterota bacterium]HMP85576.1 hypothetical protein [Candidatus Paceibacterota bacterium]